MRTTVDLDEQLLRTAEKLAEERGQTRNGFPVLPVPAGARAVTPDHVEELLQ